MSSVARPDGAVVAIVYHSGTGKTAKLAEAAAAGVREAGGDAHVIAVKDGQAPWDELGAADAIVFACPTHMGSVSASYKAFMDASARIWLQGGWRDKIGAGLVTSGAPSGDKLGSLLQLAVFAAQHGMLWVGLDVKTGEDDGLNRLGSWLGAMGQGDIPVADLRTAAHLGRRVAATAQRWRRGRPAP